MGLVYGTERARQTIMTHPNHEHLLRVLDETRSKIGAGSMFGPRPQTPDTSPEAEQVQSWSQAEIDEDALLTDEEVDWQSQKRTF